MFSSHGQVSSMRITLINLLEKIVMPGLNSVKAMWGGKEKGPSKSTNKIQSDAWCNIPLGEEFFIFILVSVFTNFIFMGYFEVGTLDFMFLVEDIRLLMMIIKTLSWQKVKLPWLKAILHAPRMWDVVHVSLLQRKQKSLVVIFYLLRLCPWCAKWRKVYWNYKLWFP